MLAVLGAIPILRFLYFLAQGSAGGHVQPLVGGLVMMTLAVLLYIVGLRATAVGWNLPQRRPLTEDVGYQSQDEQAIRRVNEDDAPADLETAREQTERNIRAA